MTSPIAISISSVLPDYTCLSYAAIAKAERRSGMSSMSIVTISKLAVEI